MYTLEILARRLRLGSQTMAYPRGPAPSLPDRHGGALRLDSARCTPGCTACADVCPTAAIQVGATTVLDQGRCLFCGACHEQCGTGAIQPTGDHRLAVRHLADLRIGGDYGAELRRAEAMGSELRSLLGRSLKLRQVSAGGCNACEADLNVLGTIGWDLGRFGIQFVASPRHADGLVLTGPVTDNMRLGLEKTWAAIPGPKIAIAVGACALSGGPYGSQTAGLHGAPGTDIPFDLYIAGCPPHPLTILEGILRLLGKVPGIDT
ncbi:MAG: 4Fe-4S binding protein [Deltaproteobacteria bacterium]|nr:4Fe-4S binding protein [Deltaproteobacteria bacterium]